MRQLREGINVPVIPAELRTTAVNECHQLPHTRCHRTYEMLKQSAYWTGMKNDVNNFVWTWLLKISNHPTQRILVSEIEELWPVDVMGLFSLTTPGNQYIIVTTEHFTRWIEAAAILDQHASSVCRTAVEHIVANHGTLRSILTTSKHQLIAGVNDTDLQRRLLVKQGVTFQEARDICEQKDDVNAATADLNVTLLQKAKAHTATRSQPVNRPSHAPIINPGSKKFSNCFSCSELHLRSSCRFHSAICRLCGKSGHIKKLPGRLRQHDGTADGVLDFQTHLSMDEEGILHKLDGREEREILDAKCSCTKRGFTN
ncbi:uncharacterized protein DEA37_0001725 [Paragonimus westermani]|uniref:Integrase zinc-binding domain-containing protein n=1 Tax=Paragonimus westermani TaxID=34504 RepID=A0A5J4NDI2_9TREM|nr:uncharacterized protein DEA37_0001725 [Paragonimus westermani]